MRKLLMGFLALVVIAGTGCTTIANWSDALFGDGRDYMIHLHSFSQFRTDDNEMRAVEYIPGKFIYPDFKPIISSVDIAKIEVIQLPTGKSLKLILDGHGRTVWTQATARLRNERLVIMVDDKYRGWIRLTKVDESGVVLLPGPFADEEVAEILDHAKKNRKK